MKNIQLNKNIIQEHFDNSTYLRGYKYYTRNLVHSCNIMKDTDTIYISSEVLGSRYYEQEIEITKINNSINILGFCSCPVGYNCKHLVATLFYALHQTDINEEEIIIDPAQQWLEKFTALQVKEEVYTRASAEYFLIYRIFQPTHNDNQLYFYKSKVLKSGQLSKGTKLANERYLSTYDYHYKFVNTLDKNLASSLNDVSKGYSREIFFESEYGHSLLKKLVDTQRCFFQDDSTALRYSPESKALTFQWQEEDNISWLESNLSENEFLIKDTVPPLCIDTQNHLMYPLDTPYDTKTLNFMLTAPKLPSHSVTELVHTVLETLPEVEFPIPKTFEIEHLSVVPTPLLKLYGDNRSTKKTIHLMKLSFDYEGNIFDSSSKSSTNIIIKEDKSLHIQRDIAKEEASRAYIESLGFFYESHPSVNAYWSKADPSMQEAIERWRIFTEEHIPKLQEEGWEIEIEESFKYRFEYIESVSIEGKESNETNPWFELSFSVDIGGRQVELLPIIAPLIEEYDSVEMLPEYLNLALEDGGYLHIDAKEIKPILATIFDLFDKKEGDKLIVKPFDAHLLDTDADIEWKGLKELRALAQKLKDFKGIEHIHCSKKLQATLRDYQEFGLDWLNFLHEFKFGGILADDMGLGKTVQTLAFLQVLKERGDLNKPTLIIMPTSLIGNWKNEIQNFTPNLSFLVLYGIDRAEKFADIHSYDIILTTYALAQRDEAKYQKEKFYYIILDEAQKIKNPKTKLAIAIKTFKSEYKLALSGTPIENHLGELWSIFDFLMSGFLDNLKTFKSFFQTPIEKEADITRRTLLNKKIAPFILRRTKDEVVHELPPKTEIIKKATFSTKQAKLYENIRVTMESKVREAIKGKGLSRSHITILDALLKLRQVCCHPQLLKLDSAKKVKESAKLDMFLELIDTLVAEGKKILVFSQFTSMLSIIETEIQQRNITYTKLTGATRKREEAIAEFTNGNASIFLISLKAGGVGLNLVEADTVIHYDPWWNPAVENQATDRAYRIGQDKAVFVYKLIIENSIEEKILQLQERKKSLQEGIYKGNEDKNDKFEGKELVQLLSI
ncbi:MAG: DEAD/DEAH box helicase [Sulfurovum sp.]|nr:DEAD/DEAH box helicase [Sulfurovum sp.]